MVEAIIKQTKLKMLVGDLTEEKTEAIVNAANSSLMGGGGVDGAIHRTGGPAILEECKLIRKRQGKLPTGQAVLTTAGKLKAKKVIHTVGPIWQGGHAQEDYFLALAYRNSLKLALENHLQTIAFPSISTGAYGFPLARASRIALQTIKDFVTEHPGFQEVRMVLYTQSDFQVYLSAWEDIIINRGDQIES